MGSASVGSIPSLSPKCTQVSAKGRPLGAETGQNSYMPLELCITTCCTLVCLLRMHVPLLRLLVYERVPLGMCIIMSHPSQGLPASEAGIKVNDIVLEVEGIDVTRASGQVVVDLIRCGLCTW